MCSRVVFSPVAERGGVRTGSTVMSSVSMPVVFREGRERPFVITYGLDAPPEPAAVPTRTESGAAVVAGSVVLHHRSLQLPGHRFRAGRGPVTTAGCVPLVLRMDGKPPFERHPIARGMCPSGCRGAEER